MVKKILVLLLVAVCSGYLGQQIQIVQQHDTCLDWGGELRADRGGVCNFDDASLPERP